MPRFVSMNSKNLFEISFSLTYSTFLCHEKKCESAGKGLFYFKNIRRQRDAYYAAYKAEVAGCSGLTITDSHLSSGADEQSQLNWTHEISLWTEFISIHLRKHCFFTPGTVDLTGLTSSTSSVHFGCQCDIIFQFFQKKSTLIHGWRALNYVQTWMIKAGVDDNMDTWCWLRRTSSKLRRQHGSNFEFLTAPRSQCKIFEDGIINVLSQAFVEVFSHVFIENLSHVFVKK